MTTTAEQDYAGDIAPDEAWVILREDSSAVLIDVRTTAEWSYVGVPDVSPLGKEVVRLSWKEFPAMSVNPNFVESVSAVVPERHQPLLFLCRSGVRSKDAAIAMTKAGYERCYNISEGFEGDRDDDKHRGTRGGWKVRGLPWVQE